MELPPPLQQLTDRLRADAAIAAAVLFGSAASGRLRADSDVDVAVLYADVASREAAEKGLVERLGNLGRVAGRDVHVVDLESADVELRRAIFQQGRCLFDRSQGRLAGIEARTAIEYVDGEYLRRVVARAVRSALEAARG